MKTTPGVAVVIMNWNGKHYLEKFMPSVYTSSYPDLQIIVGDNASTDGSVDFIAENYPDARIIRNQKNYGFAEGYNRVLNQVTADYFVLLNSDVEVEPGWIEPVISMLERDQAIAAVQPQIISWNNKDRFEYAGAAGGFIDKLGYPFCRGRIFDTLERNTGQYREEKEIFWASGAALFIRSSCWREAGGFDASFFAHMEEIDLCWRLKIAGYKIFCCPQSTVYHVGGGTLNAESPYKTYLNFRNNLFMLKKNLPANKSRRVIFIRFVLDFITLLRFFLQGKMKSAAAVSRAHRHYLRDSGTIEPVTDFSKFNPTGLYGGSIVWDYFVRKKKTFKTLYF